MDFIPFELAKKLKEKGFDWKTEERCVEKIPESEHEEWNDELCVMETAWEVNTYPKPRISEALKWLREEKKIHICISYDGDYSYDIVSIDDCEFKGAEDNYDTYEQATIAGIEYCLDNLI